MREYLVKTQKVGESLIIALPKELVAAEQLSPDITIKITVQKTQRGTAPASRRIPAADDDDPWRLLE
jgi:antitoxin component of MazEF toxin-antitoxin module